MQEGRQVYDKKWKVVLKGWPILSIVLLLLISDTISAQIEIGNDSFSEKMLIRGCAAYRSSVIHGLIDVMVDFNRLVDSLKAVADHPDGHELFRERFMHGILNEPFYNVRELITDVYPFMKILDQSAYRTYKDWGHRNRFSLFEINVLSYNLIVEPKQPFKLTNLKSFWEEISFYDIHADQTIIDVGAGNGFVSFILGMSGIPLSIYMTEIDEDYFPYLTRHLEVFNQMNEPAKIVFLKGTEKSVAVPGVVADRIILRDAFHHFKYPEEMLASIADQLSDDGYLVLLEATTDLARDKKNLCRDAISQKKILEIMTMNGFVLVEKKIVDVSLLMKFKKDQAD